MSDTEDFEKITSIYSTLYPYQQENLLSDLENCTILNNTSRNYCIKVCPKCGSENPRWTRGGKANVVSGFSARHIRYCRHESWILV